eukprot:scaffold72388_cov75-Phaeocystis_antarctica.AAC.1
MDQSLQVRCERQPHRRAQCVVCVRAPRRGGLSRVSESVRLSVYLPPSRAGAARARRAARARAGGFRWVRVSSNSGHELKDARPTLSQNNLCHSKALRKGSGAPAHRAHRTSPAHESSCAASSRTRRSPWRTPGR